MVECVKQAMLRVSGLKPVSHSYFGRSSLSFRMRPLPVRLQVSCAVSF